jgi:hypothetical protein
VSGDVRTLSAYPFPGADTGAQYDLALTPTGTTYTNTFGSELLDGTTDGTYNYAVQWSTSSVVRFDADWTNGQIACFSTARGVLLITYVPRMTTALLGLYGKM